MSNEISSWADSAQFRAQPHEHYEPFRGVIPKVHLLWMTPDPLGAMAAMSEMYEGNVITSLDQVTNQMRQKSLDAMRNTHLPAPMEAVKFHFMIDGVDRAFTHQMVRQRTAVYAQESMRFAVQENLPVGTSLPPSLFGTAPLDDDEVENLELMPEADRQAQGWRYVWDDALQVISAAYTRLVEAGMPAEEARGLLPHATATRLNYVTDFRNIVSHAGNRLCTQAQFHWRLVFNEMIKAIREYAGDPSVRPEDEWQFEAIADSSFWRPACYQLGHCPFKASFDRACSIRDRVDAYAEAGVPSSEWHTETVRNGRVLQSINPAEWLLNPGAARS